MATAKPQPQVSAEVYKQEADKLFADIHAFPEALKIKAFETVELVFGIIITAHGCSKSNQGIGRSLEYDARNEKEWEYRKYDQSILDMLWTVNAIIANLACKEENGGYAYSLFIAIPQNS